MVAGSVATEVEVKVPVERVWRAIKDSNQMFPKALPEAFTSIETIQGDGKVGSVRLIKFGPAVPHEFAKEKLESIDDAAHSVIFSTIEGGPLETVFKSQKATVSLKPSSEASGTIVTWNVEYESVVEDPPLDRMKGNAEKIIKGVEGYLLANNDYSEQEQA